jgi:hypothetical protein
MFAPPQNHLKALSFVFADVLEWIPKSAGNAFLAVEIFHFRLPDSRWHLRSVARFIHAYYTPPNEQLNLHTDGENDRGESTPMQVTLWPAPLESV